MLKPAVFTLGFLPFVYSAWQVWLLSDGQPNNLGADPGKELLLFQGEWAIRFLVLTLMVSPIRKLTDWREVMKVRRMLGLFTFFYASLHLLAYSVFLLELNFARIGAELVERPFIALGFVAWLALLPLAVTSVDFMVRRLGRRWRQLHMLVYMVAVLAIVHVFWLAKSSYLEAAIYGGILAILLVYRLFKGQKDIFQAGIKALA